MIDSLIQFSIARRWVIIFLVLVVSAAGIWNYQKLPIDAVPDITNVQVQINTEAPGYSPLEVEQRITYLVELAITGLPKVESTRSISRYALSQVTVVFEKGTDIYFARNLINERLQQAKSEMPVGIEPIMGPVATGLGEIFHYAVRAHNDARQPNGMPYDATALRTLQDWVIRPQLRQVPGVTEINTIGGFEKQFHITPDPARLLSYQVSFEDLIEALEKNNANVGAGYIEKNGEQYLIRAPGQVDGIDAIKEIIVARNNGVPILIKDVASVNFGQELRTGAATLNGQETVLGTAVMLLGGNSRTISEGVSNKLESINETLPDGVTAEPVYNRTVLVDKTISTVQTNLMEGALLVVVVLLVMLGNVRAALLTALVIPLSMLMLITGMVETKVSANLMSLGALDFGLIVDGAVIIVENCILRLAERQHHLGKILPLNDRIQTVFTATREVFTPSLISVLVVILVNIPILALTGVEGKMFTPMAMAVIMALVSALILSLTFVPAAVALLLRGHIKEKDNFIVRNAKSLYAPFLEWALRFRISVLVIAALFVIATGFLATRMGTEFIPNLDEGDIAVQALRIPGTSLTQSLDMQFKIEKAVTELPEIENYFSRVGTAEVAADPMGPNISDGYVMLAERSQWPDPEKTKPQLLKEIQDKLKLVPGNAYEISQPIQMRVNELISGVRSDLGIKVYGDNLEQLLKSGNEIASIIAGVTGAEDIKVEQVSGLPILSVETDRKVLHRYGLNINDVQKIIATATGGEEAGLVFEGDRRYAIVVRLVESQRNDINALGRLPIPLPNDSYVPLREVATLKLVPGPNQISRENGKRRLVVSVNVRGRDLGGFVTEVQEQLQNRLSLPPGYWLDYGGTFEQLQSASARLSLLVPITLVMIFALLMMTFGSAKDAALVFSGVPLALTGGVIALWIRDIPLSITAGVGFITLCGVSVLTGVMMVSAFRSGLLSGKSIELSIREGALLRLRPILMVALVAALGFLPMALNTGTGAEVQRPLATVVIGGIISSTLLTLAVLPGLYRMAASSKNKQTL
ncbi:efflux RND transporter permease subunit [Aliikangiella sp. IMCC44359]|uniref:efflux RND transporter permease subunit n=1 Tax=Aliikangiella sp. IMCC44359 TaxID=3459125 RepID=UPI00403AC576